MTPPPPSTRILSVTVDKLFGLYDHRIALNAEERVTILHGPNGVGKTVILKLIAALFAGRLDEVAAVPFERFAVTLSDGSVLSVQRKVAEATAATLHYRSAGGAESTLALEPVREQGGIQRFLLQLNVERSNSVPRPSSGRHRPAWLEAVRSQLRIHLIETQRLFRFPAPAKQGRSWLLDDELPHMVATVHEHSAELRKRATEALAAYASESQALDQSFPQRLLRAPSTELAPEAIKDRMRELEQRRARLTALGLLEPDRAAAPFDIASLDNLGDTERRVMTLYVEDTARKLGALDDLSRRIELLTGTINATFKHKTLRFDPASGLTVRRHDGAPLALDALSSGEQHELVVLYDLLFNVAPDTLVLIDEPELSLHVIWQKRFLADLLQIVQAVHFDVVIATHSPYIAGSHPELMVGLAAEAE